MVNDRAMGLITWPPACLLNELVSDGCHILSWESQTVLVTLKNLRGFHGAYGMTQTSETSDILSAHLHNYFMIKELLVRLQ